MELGINTFGDSFFDPQTGKTISHAERLQELVREGVAKIKAERNKQVFNEDIIKISSFFIIIQKVLGLETLVE